MFAALQLRQAHGPAIKLRALAQGLEQLRSGRLEWEIPDWQRRQGPRTLCANDPWPARCGESYSYSLPLRPARLADGLGLGSRPTTRNSVDSPRRALASSKHAVLGPPHPSPWRSGFRPFPAVSRIARPDRRYDRDSDYYSTTGPGVKSARFLGNLVALVAGLLDFWRAGSLYLLIAPF